jgi:hypothetical protein
MKILQNKIIGTQISFLSSRLGFILFFIFHECLHYYYMYIFIFHTCTIIIITLEPCALKIEFQHFILRFYFILFFCKYHWEKWDKGWKQAQKHSEVRVTLWRGLICDFICDKNKLYNKFPFGIASRKLLIVCMILQAC